MDGFSRVWTADARREYEKGRLSRSEVDPDPMRQFQRWYEEGRTTLREPNGMTLATADAHGRPSARMVLLKGFDSKGFVFATSYLSRKASEIESNPQGALLFYWAELERQVRVVGPMSRTSAAESDEIFRDRPRLSRLAAVVSRQSEPVSHRVEMETAMEKADEHYDGKEVTRPDFWGGYRLVPEEFEFWQGRRHRLHDRLAYLPDGRGGWKIERLQP